MLHFSIRINVSSYLFVDNNILNDWTNQNDISEIEHGMDYFYRRQALIMIGRRKLNSVS